MVKKKTLKSWNRKENIYVHKNGIAYFFTSKNILFKGGDSSTTHDVYQTTPKELHSQIQ